VNQSIFRPDRDGKLCRDADFNNVAFASASLNPIQSVRVACEVDLEEKNETPSTLKKKKGRRANARLFSLWVK